MSNLVEKIEEVVLAVRDQDKVVKLFEDVFGFRFNESWTVPVDSMKVKCARIGETQFHVVGSIDPDPELLINRFLDQRGEGIHHIAFKVKDLDEMIRIIRDKGLKLIPEKPREGRDGTRYIFVHPKSAHGLLIELIEKK
jgi:methylmalonyl-CoA epimerase